MKNIKVILSHTVAIACGTCPLCLHKVNFEVFTPWGVKFLWCHGYACAACDVHVICEAKEIKHHIQRWQGTNFRGLERVLVRRKQLMSLPFSNFETIDVSFLYTKKSRTWNMVNVKWHHIITSVVYSIYGRSQDCHGSWPSGKAGTRALTRTPCGMRDIQLEAHWRILPKAQDCYLGFHRMHSMKSVPVWSNKAWNLSRKKWK